MQKKFEALKTQLAEIDDLHRILSVLGWDQQTNMPRGGSEDRARQISTLERLAHEKFIDPKIGELLDDLKSWQDSLSTDSDGYRFLKLCRRNYEKSVKVPPKLVSALAKVTTEAYQVWEEAREKSEFKLFQSHLSEIIELRREYANLFQPFDHIYDPLIDDFEPGVKSSEIKLIFDQLRQKQVKLVKAIQNSQQVDDSFLHIDYDEQKQWDFGVEVMSKFGFDWNRGRQDKSAHPFTATFALSDVRVTTRVHRDLPASAMFSSMHECGHALYEQGVAANFARSPLGSVDSLALHESQSRLFENLVGRSYDFWKAFYPRLLEFFPSQLGNIDLKSFYNGINKVEASFIRVEADEATYNLHVMLRFELEMALMEGSLDVADLPEIWREKMREYLGVVPENEADGVLQDVHWSCGAFGYFPTYTLGNLAASQIWEKINLDIPDLNSNIEKGDFKELLSWLRENIHRHGGKYSQSEILVRATGKKLDSDAYMSYLTKKYGEIYNLNL